jgi:hypothetical protein
MKTRISLDRNPDRDSGVLKTKFVTPDQAATLTQMLDLTLEELSQVAGGEVLECACVNCCTAHRVVLTGQPA